MRSLIISIPLALGLLAGCGEVDQTFDCIEICDEFNDCLTGFDVDETECIDRCEDNNTDAEVDRCEECVDASSNACMDCSAQCGDVFVPAT